jgi:hypothetical protein
MDKRSIETITQDILQDMAVPTVATKSHQVQLKQALLAASLPPQQTAKQNWRNLMTKPKFIISSAVFAILATIALGVFTIQQTVSAAELTRQSLDKVSQLSPSELQELDLRIGGNPKAELEAAKNAKDLKVMTYEEYSKLTTQGEVRQLPDNKVPSPKSLKYLRYTDKDEAVHTIGVDKDGLPVIVMVSKQGKDGSGQSSVQLEAGGSGAVVDGPTGSAPGGMSTCSAEANSQPVCTNSDGSPAPMSNCQTLSNGNVTCSTGAGTVKQQ